MKIRDSSDHCRRRDEMIAVGEQLLDQIAVFGITLNEFVPRVAVIRFLERAILTEIVEPGHLVIRSEEFLDQIAADEPRRAGSGCFHSRSGPSSRRCSPASWPGAIQRRQLPTRPLTRGI